MKRIYLFLVLILASKGFVLGMDETRTTDEMTFREWIEAFSNLFLTGRIDGKFLLEKCKNKLKEFLMDEKLGNILNDFSNDKTILTRFFDEDVNFGKKYFEGSGMCLSSLLELLYYKKKAGGGIDGLISQIKNNEGDLQEKMCEKLESLFSDSQTIILACEDSVCLDRLYTILLKIFEGQNLCCSERRCFISVFAMLVSDFVVSELEIEKIRKKRET